MKVLHIYKKIPEEMVEILVKEQMKIVEITEIRLYEEPVDYDKLIQALETTDKVFTW